MLWIVDCGLVGLGWFGFRGVEFVYLFGYDGAVVVCL